MVLSKFGRDVFQITLSQYYFVPLPLSFDINVNGLKVAVVSGTHRLISELAPNLQNTESFRQSLKS